MAVRSLIKSGSSNVEGAANGPMGAFVISTVWLAPWALQHVKELTQIASPMQGMTLQGNLFIWLRTGTLLASILSVIGGVYVLVHRKEKTREWWYVSFWVFAPLWLLLSNYFKYDILLMCAVVAVVILLQRFAYTPTLKWFCLACAGIGGAVAIKVSAVPLLIVAALLFFTKVPPRRMLLFGLYGFAAFLTTVGLLGFPDMLILGKGEYLSFFYDNIVTVPSTSADFVTGHTQFVYLSFFQFPYQFGYGFVAFLGTCLLTLGVSVLLKKDSLEKITQDEVFYLIGLLAFLLSILPLKLMMVGNRWLVLLPWLFWLGYALWQRVVQTKLYRMHTRIYRVILMLCVITQLLHGSAVLSTRLEQDVRVTASEKITELPEGSTLGIENIPIYQMLPDLVLSEYYQQLAHSTPSTVRTYQVIDPTQTQLPDIVLLTNVGMSTLFPVTTHAEVVKSLRKNGYVLVWQLKPPLTLHRYFGTEEQFALSGLNAIPMDISYYARHN